MPASLSGTCLTPSPHQNTLSDGHPRAPRVEGPSQGCSGTRPHLGSAWLIWLPHTQHFTQPELIYPKEKVTRYFWATLHHFCTKTLYGVLLPDRFAQPSPERVTKSVPGWAWGRHHTACAFPSPGVLDRGYILLPKCGHGGKCERGREFGEMAPEGHCPRGSPTLGTAGVTWPGCRKGLSGLGDPSLEGLAELLVFALQNLLWVSVLHLQEACALCK